MKYLIYWLFERKIIKDNNIFSRCLEKILLCFAFIYKKKKLNLDQALQTENRDPSKKCTDSNTQKQTLCFRNLQFFFTIYIQISAKICLSQKFGNNWRDYTWLKVLGGSQSVSLGTLLSLVTTSRLIMDWTWHTLSTR